jgi:putative transposase
MRFRLYPMASQTETLARHCSDARYIWNLALEQWNHWQPGFKPAPGYVEQARQLTELREAVPWVAQGSVTVQQQALRDFHQAWRNFFGGTHGRPTWRRKGVHEGFRIVAVKPGHIQRLNRHWGQVRIPKAGWVRFRMSRPVPAEARSYRVNLKAGQWHIAFAVKPEPIDGPGDGSVLGIDRGVVIPIACSDKTSYAVPGLDPREHRIVKRLQRKESRQKKGSGRRARTRLRINKLKGREVARRRDAIEKATTDLARRCDFFRIEDLRIRNMTKGARGTKEMPGRKVRHKAGLNRAILQSGWGLFGRRLEDKAPYRVERVNPAFSSQHCVVCGYTAPENRESQAVFRCKVCGYTANADFNAAETIAGGHPVTARGGMVLSGLPMNREPQLPTFDRWVGSSNLPALKPGEDVKSASGDDTRWPCR